MSSYSVNQIKVYLINRNQEMRNKEIEEEEETRGVGEREGDERGRSKEG